VTSIDSKQFHVNLLGSKNLTFQRFSVKAPGHSPNTDGIHIGRSEEINIIDSNIMTGDDCISIGRGSRQVRITNVRCGHGHGISIGSLGKYEKEEPVSGIYVKNCTIYDTDMA
jgi:Endopolygalacturonase